MGTYALLLAAGRLKDRRAAARRIAAATGRTALDALQAIHHGRGILATRLAGEQVQRLGRELAALGLETFAVPDEALVPPVRPWRVTKAAPGESQLVIEDQFQRRQAEPWAELRLLCAGTVQEPGTVEPEAGARALAALADSPRALGGDEEESGRRQHFADLVFGEPPERHYRLEAAAFSYQYLAAAGRLALRHEANWVALLSDLIAGGGQAVWVTEAARAMAAGRVVESAVVEELRLYDAEVRWRLQRLRVLGPGND